MNFVKINHLSLEDGRLRSIILKHAFRNSMKNSNESATKTEPTLEVTPELEFPDWSGMSSRRIQLSFEQMLRHNEKLRLLFPPKPGEAERRLARRCMVEFIL